MTPRKPITLCLFALALAPSAMTLHAQTTDGAETKATKSRVDHSDFVVKTYRLNNVSQQNDANEILVALRNTVDASAKIYLVSAQNAIVIDAPPEQQAITQKLISDLDRPKKTYRLTYTLTEEDGGKRVGTQHYSMIVVAGQKTSLKQGSKVPIATGSYNTGSSANAGSAAPGVQTQFTYLDIGMNFSASVDEVQRGAHLQSRVEQSSIGEEKSGTVEQDPVVRQTVLESNSFLTLGKPLILGTVDVPGTTRRVDIEAVLELVPDTVMN